MRILLIGATGTIGKAIAAALGGRHEVLLASRQQAPLRVDIADPASIRSLYAKVGKVGAVISAAGQARFKPFDELSDADFRFSVDNKLMGQVNLVRYGLASVVDGGSITITSGVLAQQPSRGSAAISLVNAGLEGFARAAARAKPSSPAFTRLIAALPRDGCWARTPLVIVIEPPSTIEPSPYLTRLTWPMSLLSMLK